MPPTPNRTPKDATDPRPLHERIATDLRRQIMTGDLAPEASLPSTPQLTKLFGASNATIQKAIGLLKAEGLLVGRPGSSVKVRAHRRTPMTPAAYSAPAGPGQPYRWISEAAKRGMQGDSRLLHVGEVTPPPHVRRALGLDEGGVALLRSQVLSLDEEPCELVHNYYPVDIARGTALMERRKIRGGTPTLLADLGYPPQRTEDEVTAETATQEEYAALKLPSDLPVLRTFRVVYSDGDRPIEVSVMAKAGHLYKLKYSF